MNLEVSEGGRGAVTEWQVRFFQPGSPVLVHQVTVTVQRAAIPSGV